MNEIALFLVLPLFTALLIVLIGRWIVKGAGLIVTGVYAVLSALVIHLYAQGGLPVSIAVGGWTPVDGVPLGIHWVIDGLSLLMLALINGIGVFVAIYSMGAMKNHGILRKYYAMLMLLGMGLNGVVLAGDLFTLYVFLEISAISTYVLVAFHGGAEELEASFKYQVLGGTASMFILLGIALLYRLTGTLNMADTSRVLLGANGRFPVQFVGILFLTGFGLKAAIMPFHAWLPDAHPAAPAPVSAMLSGVVIKVLGIYPLCRLFFHVLGFQGIWPQLWLILGGLSLMLGNILTLAQYDIKRMLAYCSVSQIGYILLAIGLGTPFGILAGLFHLVNHAVYKALLFFNAGAIEHATGHRDMRRMGGLSKIMPVTHKTTLIATFSVAGLPPFAGFWSKLFIILACIQAGKPFWAVWAALGSMLTLWAFLKMQRHVFGGPLNPDYQHVREAASPVKVAMVALAAFCIIMGVLALPTLRATILEPASALLSRGLAASAQLLGE